MVLFDIKCNTDRNNLNELIYTTTSLAVAIQVFRAYYHEVQSCMDDIPVIDKDRFEEWVESIYSFLSWETGENYTYFISDNDRIFFSIIIYEPIEVEDDIPAIVKEDIYAEI